MIQFEIIEKGTPIPEGTYFSRTAVLDLIQKRYGYKSTFHEILIIKYFFIEEWYTDYIHIHDLEKSIWTNDLIDYIKEKVEPKVVLDKRIERVFDAVINSIRYIIEEEINENFSLYTLTAFDETGKMIVDLPPFTDVSHAKLYIINQI